MDVQKTKYEHIPKLAYTLGEASLATGVSVNHLRNLIASKEINPTRCGRRVLIRHVELERYLEASTGGGIEDP